MDFQEILLTGITINSSGSTGSSKAYWQPPAKIKKANEVARMVQGITRESKIYTVCKLAHAGGLFAQTLPAFEIGAIIDIEPFNAYNFVKKIRNYTHSHITPLHVKAIMLTKGFAELDLTGITITCGAEPVTWDIIEAFVAKGCKFIVNWGMSEIGPVAINHKFKSLEEVYDLKNLCPKGATIMGSNKHCDYKIENEELAVKGDICIYDDWYYTKDKVVENGGILFYTGRTNKEVDFDNPVKG